MNTTRDMLEMRRQFRTSIEVRKQADDEVIFTGHASVTDKTYRMYGGPPIGWNETVATGAFKKTLSESPDVVFLVNHDGLPLARTKSGTLTLTEDKTGLAVEARLDGTDPDVQRLVPKIERGDLSEMSFAFRITRQQWLNADGEEVESWRATDRKILEVSLNRGDVSTVTYGANPHTSGTLRAADALAELARVEADQLDAWRDDPELVGLIRAARANLARAEPQAPVPTMTLAHAQAIAATL